MADEANLLEDTTIIIERADAEDDHGTIERTIAQVEESRYSGARLAGLKEHQHGTDTATKNSAGSGGRYLQRHGVANKRATGVWMARQLRAK